MKKMQEDKLRVLGILRENLTNPQPQVVGLEKIAEELQQGQKETRQLLLSMTKNGEIESDLEGRYALITRTGLYLLNSIPPVVVAERLPSAGCPV
jgi:DNA-binding IclR family transcriptional regulator